MSGIPVFNVNNSCSTGSTALYLARQAIESGAADCVLALGFEQMNPGALGPVFTDRPSPFEDFDRETDALVGMSELPLALRRKELSVEDVMTAPMLWPGVLTRLMACPPTCSGLRAWRNATS